jgi:hypothetical protein
MVMNRTLPRLGDVAKAACLASLLFCTGCTQEVIPAEDFVEDVTEYLLNKGLIEADGGRVSTGDQASSGGLDTGSALVEDVGDSSADAVADVSQASPSDAGAATTTDTGSSAGECKTAADCPKAGPPCLAADCDQGICGWKQAVDGQSCGAQCTKGGACIGGQCMGSSLTPEAPCDDGDGCTSKDKCNSVGMCIGKLQKCDDDNSCTDDTCTSLGPSSSKCEHNKAKMDGKLCQEMNSKDPSQCHLGTCQQGACTGISVKKTCDDDNPCSDDLCLIYESNYCIYPPTLKSKVPCNKVDGMPASVCEIATCETGTGKCKVTGKYLASDKIKCSTSTDCGTGAGKKEDGLCDNGTCSACNDGNACTATDACDGKGGCMYSNAKSGTACKTAKIPNGQCDGKGVCGD